MSQLGHADTFRDLVVYQKSRSIAKKIFELSKRFPKEETYSLTDQIRRSSRSIGAQIAEAWAKRRYVGHFVSKLTDSDAEQQETQHWVEVALDCEYLDRQMTRELLDDLSEIGRMLQSMMSKSELFCCNNRSVVRETGAEYYVNSTDH